MPKYVCSTDEKYAWKLPPGEASKQTFTNEKDVYEWYENEFPGQKIEMTKYTFDGDHWQNEVFANGKSIGQVDKYADLKSAQLIYPIVRDYFENQKATNPQAITQPKSNIEQLTGQQYKITKENQNNTLSFKRTSDNVSLIKANLNTGEITINRGLTESDVNNFQQIQQVQQATKIYKVSYGLFAAMKGYGRTTGVSPGVETVNTRQYILKLDNNENTLSVSAQDGRGEIVKFNFNNHQLETAQNITENDINNWKQINQALNNTNILNRFSTKGLEI